MRTPQNPTNVNRGYMNCCPCIGINLIKIHTVIKFLQIALHIFKILCDLNVYFQEKVV